MEDLRPSFTGVFGKAETESAVWHLTRFFIWSERPWTASFSLLDLLSYYRQHDLPLNLFLFGLLGSWEEHSDPGYLYQTDGLTYQLTKNFCDKIFRKKR